VVNVRWGVGAISIMIMMGLEFERFTALCAAIGAPCGTRFFLWNKRSCHREQMMTSPPSFAERGSSHNALRSNAGYWISYCRFCDYQKISFLRISGVATSICPQM